MNKPLLIFLCILPILFIVFVAIHPRRQYAIFAYQHFRTVSFAVIDRTNFRVYTGSGRVVAGGREYRYTHEGLENIITIIHADDLDYDFKNLMKMVISDAYETAGAKIWFISFPKTASLLIALYGLLAATIPKKISWRVVGVVMVVGGIIWYLVERFL
jgi:hypothetical protein